MLKQAYELAQVKKPLIAATLIHYKQAAKQAEDAGAAEPGMMDKAKAMGSDALEAGKRYGPGVGIGAGAGALAGLPISLLANAVFGKDKSLRGYLRSALMGSLIGGGVGGLGAGALKYYGESSPERGAKVDDLIALLPESLHAELLRPTALDRWEASRKGDMRAWDPDWTPAPPIPAEPK